jgi:hypothetical protein
MTTPTGSRLQGRFFCTQHAIERFHERVAPGLSFPHAKRELILLTESARKTDIRTATGDEVWVCEGGARLVVRKDRRFRQPTVITVLPPDAVPNDDGIVIDEDEGSYE